MLLPQAVAALQARCALISFSLSPCFSQCPSVPSQSIAQCWQHCCCRRQRRSAAPCRALSGCRVLFRYDPGCSVIEMRLHQIWICLRRREQRCDVPRCAVHPCSSAVCSCPATLVTSTYTCLDHAPSAAALIYRGLAQCMGHVCIGSWTGNCSVFRFPLAFRAMPSLTL